MINWQPAFWHFLFWLVVAHALCDMPLQPDRLSRMKYRHTEEGSRGKWIAGLSCHAIIHAGGVAIVTGSIGLGMFEFVAHWAIDAGKGERMYGLGADQVAHLACKVAWAAVAVLCLISTMQVQ